MTTATTDRPSVPMTPEQRALRLSRINAKGFEVATKLAELKAGKDVSLGEIDVHGLPLDKRRKEERLRAFLETVNLARRRLNEGGYGHCLRCGEALSDGQLDEMPWVERCAGCEAA